MNISAVVLTKNEEENIVDCLESLSWCNEIVVIDDNSEDRTIEIAKNYGAKVFVNSLQNDFSKQRIFGLSKATNDWVLFVDADERVSEVLASEIFNFLPIKSGSIFNSFDGFYIKRLDYMWGKELKHGETGNIKLLRLAKKNAGLWKGKIHETWDVKGKIGELTNPLLHFPHKTLNEFLNEINFYTDIRVKELYDQKVTVYWWSIILYPKLKFFVNYFLKLGFLDGIQGLVFAIIMSFHSFLVRGKLWMLWQKE